MVKIIIGIGLIKSNSPATFDWSQGMFLRQTQKNIFVLDTSISVLECVSAITSLSFVYPHTHTKENETSS